MRRILSWWFYYMGDFVYKVFDQWLKVGMRMPVYRVYNNLMNWSSAIQGEGKGPWK